MDIMKMGKNPNYLGSWDLEELPNREITLTIEQITDEEVATNGNTELCTTCHWTDHGFKPMILNVTNKKTLCKLYKTKNTEKFIGKSVTIGTNRVKAFGNIYDALRIRPHIPQPKRTEFPKCECCGNEIHAAGKLLPEQVAAYTKQKYGKSLCGTCATEASKEATKNATEQ